MPDDISKKAWTLVHKQLDRTITALKNAGRYGDAGARGEKRGADGEPKPGGSFIAAENASAQQSAELPVEGLPGVLAHGEAGLDFARLTLKNPVDVAAEMTAYFTIPVQSMAVHKDPLALWANYRKLCPGLAVVAMHYLSMPAGSSAVERVFSKCGIIKSKLRNRLKGATLEMLIYLNLNWDNSLYNVRPQGKKKKDGGVDESKGGEEGEEKEERGGESDDEEDEEEAERWWADLEREIAEAEGEEQEQGWAADDPLGVTAQLNAMGFEEPDAGFWEGFEDIDRWMDDE